jgi:hypothetical protein
MPTNPCESPKAESTVDRPAPPRRNWRDYSPEFNAAFRTALIIQCVLAVLTALMLDLGQTHQAFWVAFLCQWAVVWIILLRRPMDPTRLDLLIVRYGIIPLLLIVANLGPLMIRVLGIQP